MTSIIPTLTTSGCRTCGMTDDSRRRDAGCGGDKYNRHDWYTLEFAICKDIVPERPGLGSVRALTLKGRGAPRKLEFGWSSTAGYHSTFPSVEIARQWIVVLDLVDVDIRQVWFPAGLDKLITVWPPEAVEPCRRRVDAMLQAEADERDRRAALPVAPDPPGDPDAWYGDRSD